MTYAEQLKHPKWQAKRLEIMQLANFQCEECGAKENQLHIHHGFYKRKTSLWEYPNRSMACLCAECHETRQGLLEELGDVVSVYTSQELDTLKCDILGLVRSIGMERVGKVAHELSRLRPGKSLVIKKTEEAS